MSTALPLAASVADAVAEVSRFGVTVFDMLGTEINIGEQVSLIAAKLGDVYTGRRGARVEYLSPKQPSEAPKRSLSAVYGTDMFPWHTDTAHRLIPARWVVMACIKPGTDPARTELLPWSLVNLPNPLVEACSVRPFAFVNGRDSFLSTVVDRTRRFIRFDPGCMQPLEREGAELLAQLATWAPIAGESLYVEWRPGRTIIFDNWNYLHRRHSAASSADRLLVRAYAA